MPEPSPEAVEALFQQAADLDPARRGAFLDEACAGDPDLRAAVEELLHFDAKAQSAPDFLHSPAADARATLPWPPEPVPAAVGRYRVVRRLGQGGMGSVYEAEQDDPQRTVALKVMRPGLDSPAYRKRFAREARILGRLHHAGIAQVYDAGATADGRLYFAMEFVRGLRLDEYARRHAPDARARLELVARVCDAVHHAHKQRVVHRDLKPANVLVDEAGQPKVLDFGVAHAAGAGPLDSSALTRTGQLIGTLGYMSPEQVAGDPRAIDARSDVYTLGVILFELLADRLPYRLDDLPIPEVVRVIREDEPSRLGSANRQFRGDVETIAAKALEKEPGRRYASAAELADDIRRHLRHEPIRARPPSALYQFGKFARRHKALVGGVAGVIAALAAGLVGTVSFAVREAEQRGRAEQTARQANDEKETALHQAYRARLAAAGAALQSHDVADAARQLADAPEDLRGWEWRHLHSRLDDSSAAFPSPGRSFLWPHTATLRREVILGRTLQLLDEQGRIERSTPLAHPEEGSGDVAWACTSEGVFMANVVAEGVVRLRHGTGKEWGRIRVPARASVNLFAISPDRKWAAVNWITPAGWSLRGYDSSGAERVNFADIHTRSLWSLSFSPDGALLTSASDDGTGGLWEVATGRAIGGALRHPGKLRLRSATFRADVTRLVTTSGDGTVCQWDARTGAAVEPPYERHTGEVWIAVYSPDGQWVASAGTDRTIRLWLATGRQEALVLRGHTGKVTQLAFTGDGRRLESVSDDGTARIWDVDPRAPLPALRDHTDNVYAVAYSPDGQWIASGSWDKTVRLWDARTGHLCATLPHPGFVRTLAFSPDGSWLVSGCDGVDRLRIWNVATGQLRREVQGPGTILQTLAVDPAGTRIAAADRDGSLRILEAATGRVVASLRMNAGFERKELAYSSDGRWLAGTGEGNKVYLWNAETNLLVSTLAGHAGEVYSVAFSPDGRLLASASQDRTVRVWDVATATCQTVLSGHTDEVFTAVFHPGGRRLASAGRDRAIWLWDLATPGGQTLVARLQGHSNYIFSLAFSPDGESLVSASGDTTVRVWDTEPLRVRHEARRATEAARPEGEQLVARLLAELRDPAQVVTRLHDDEKLIAPLRRAAMQALMRRGEQARP